jgi:hypothetical protein
MKYNKENISMFSYVFPIIGIVGGILLIYGGIKKMPQAPPWSKLAIRTAGFCALIWAILIIVQINNITAFDTVAGRALQSAKIFVGGMMTGILITVIIAGVFKNKSKNETTT